MEYRWHAGIFATCADVHGVVHTHSTATMAFGCVGTVPPLLTGRARVRLVDDPSPAKLSALAR